MSSPERFRSGCYEIVPGVCIKPSNNHDFQITPLPNQSYRNMHVHIPLAVINLRRIIRNNHSIEQGLVQWKDLPPEDSTWEDLDSLPSYVQQQNLDTIDHTINNGQINCFPKQTD